MGNSIFNSKDITVKIALNFTVLFVALLAGHANAAFVHDYDVGNWHKAVHRGSINTKGAPDSIKLIGSNTLNPRLFKARNQDFTIASMGTGLVTFDWSFRTSDKHGARFDPFGFILNGIFHKLTDNSRKRREHGTFSFEVHKGDVFGFRQRSINSEFGAATTTVSNFSAPVPIPAAIWLMTSSLLGLFGMQRKQKMI